MLSWTSEQSTPKGSLHRWSNGICRSNSSTNATPEARLEYSNAIAALKQKRDEAAEKLKGISAASDDEWEELKTGAEQVWGDIKKMLRDAIKKIK